jgi:hypothetical protein
MAEHKDGQEIEEGHQNDQENRSYLNCSKTIAALDDCQADYGDIAPEAPCSRIWDQTIYGRQARKPGRRGLLLLQ